MTTKMFRRLMKKFSRKHERRKERRDEANKKKAELELFEARINSNNVFEKDEAERELRQRIKNLRRTHQQMKAKKPNYDTLSTGIKGRCLKLAKVKRHSHDNPSYNEAKKRKDWPKFQEAIEAEMFQIVNEEGVLEFVKKKDIPDGVTPLASMFVLTIKRSPSGEVDKYKARLVAFGNQQKSSSYDQIKSGTARSATVKILISIQAKKGATSMVLDVKGAYLKSVIDESKGENLYLRLPDGRLAKLKKYLYVLKQAGYEWQANLTSTLLDAGYSQSSADPLAFSKWAGQEFIVMCIHVDDFYVVSSKPLLMGKLHLLLNRKYGEVSIKTGDLLAYLGMQVSVNESDGSIFVSQPGYTEKLLTLVEFDAKGWKIARTPMSAIDPSVRDGDEEPVEVEAYLQLVGGLNYLAQFTRPYIMFALSRAAQRCSHPVVSDLRMVHRIFRYVAGTRLFGIKFEIGEIVLVCHVDASHNCYDDARGHYGYCFSLGEGDGVFYAKSAKLKLTTLSSTESEYVALCEAARDIVWLRRLLGDIGFTQNDATKAYEDNMSCIEMVQGRSNHKASKHINPKFHFACEQVRKGKMVVVHKATNLMVADILTKALSSLPFQALTSLILNMVAISGKVKK